MPSWHATPDLVADPGIVADPDLVADPDIVADGGERPRLPFSFARAYNVLLDGEPGGDAVLHYAPGVAMQTLSEVMSFLGRPFVPKPVSVEEFQRRLTQFYQHGNEDAAQAAEDIDADMDLSRLADEMPDTTDLMEGEDDAPIIRMINAVLSQAIREQASDIHIETFEDRLVVRFRIDGVLREVLSPKRMLAPLLVSRLKVMAKLDIAEKRIPQDGRISVRIAGHTVDIRMSTLPSAHGERVVLRLLDTQAGRLEIEELNMQADVDRSLRAALSAAHGVILVTGPTGSGKTTTLYAGLTSINDVNRNIMTIEDPVEYMLEGIGQTQVNTKVDMSFARGLRAILRQDPDIIMIGEIRDLETAEIAIQASLTGHLVLSTLHTNTAIGAVTRLHDMGVEPFLLSSSLSVLTAQRLIRLLCLDCRKADQASQAERERFSLAEGQTIYRAIGCDRCGHTGYHGRTGIYELIVVDDRLREMIHDEAGEHELSEYAHRRHGTLFQDGCRCALSGQTTLEEVLRVTLSS